MSKADDKAKTVLPVVKSGQKVQIGLPKLCNYDDDDEDEDEEEATAPKTTLRNLNPPKPSESKVVEKPRSGLLSILPPPKSAQNPFLKKPVESSAPASTSNTNEKLSSSQFLLPRHMMGKMPVKIADQETEYRPMGKKSQPILAPPVLEEDPEPFADEKNEETTDNGDDYEEDDEDDEDNKEENVDITPTTSTMSSVAQSGAGQQMLDKEAMLRLCGSQGKKRKFNDFELTEVNASAIVGDNQSELLKQVTEAYRPPSNKEYFSTSSRRTHHVTYLAKVALERDQELRASWAQNKFNKRMAREKYGF